MNPKYYPHVTIFAAAIMTVAPLCFVLALPYLRVGGEINVESFAGESATGNPVVLNTRLSEPIATPRVPAAVESAAAGSEELIAAAPSTTQPERQTQATQTRVAMRTAEEPSFSEVPNISSVRPERPQATRSADAAAVLEMAAADDASPDPDRYEKSMPVPDPAPLHESSTPTAKIAPSYRDPWAEVAEPPSVAVADVPEADATMSEAHNTAAEEEPPFIEPRVNPPSMFSATGHLSLAGGTTGAMAGTPAAVQNKSPAPVVTKEAVVADNPTPKVPLWKQNRTKVETSASPAVANVRVPDVPDGADPFVPGFGMEPVARLEDVILQQPLENRHVARMENLVAVTRAAGWPIALVRSDLPDDHWWVQQMVGIRGNAFAARVNFGNDDSISGSVYRLVIVFLDSPDEVRRFRIAKQFKELPEGVRRTREFTFVRQ